MHLDFTVMKAIEARRKRLLLAYQRINLLSFLILLAFLGLGVYQFFFKIEHFWPLLLIAVFGLGLLLSSWQSHQQFKEYQGFWEQAYLPALLELVAPRAQYCPSKDFDKKLIPGLFSEEEELEVEELKHYIKGPLGDGQFHLIRLKILEWQGKRRKKASVRFEGLFLRIEALAEAKAIMHEEAVHQLVEQLGERGYGAELRLAENSDLLLYIYSDKAFLDGRPNEHIKQEALPQKLAKELQPLLDLIHLITALA